MMTIENSKAVAAEIDELRLSLNSAIKKAVTEGAIVNVSTIEHQIIGLPPFEQVIAEVLISPFKVEV